MKIKNFTIIIKRIKLKWFPHERRIGLETKSYSFAKNLIIEFFFLDQMLGSTQSESMKSLSGSSL